MVISRRSLITGAAASSLMPSSAWAGVRAASVTRSQTRTETILARMQSGYYDVVIYGGTLSGICAAITAVKMGAKTLLLEPTAHLGGVVLAGGLMPWDARWRDHIGGTVWQIMQQIAVIETSGTRWMPTTEVSFSSHN